MSVERGSDRVIELTHELHDELRVQTNPQRRALARLKPKPGSFGWTELPYEQGAFDIWSDQLARAPDDWRTRHHLAIAHHARAFDLENSADPAAADADWARALELWHALWIDDAFWVDLTSRLEAGLTDPFPALRARWPLELLRVHLAIALDETTKNYRRRTHMRLVLDSPFPASIVDRIRLEAFESVTAHVPAAIWSAGSFDPEATRVGLQAVTRYMELDDSFLAALKDLLRLLCKLQTAEVQSINSVDGDERERGLRVVRALAAQYGAYVSRLEQHLAKLETDTLADLTLWHSRSGQAARLLGDHQAASGSFFRAYQTARLDGSSDAEEMRIAWMTAALYHARRLATGGRDDHFTVRDILQEIALENELPPLCLMLRANTLLLLEDFDSVHRDCQTALAQIEHIKKTGASDREALDCEAPIREIQQAATRARRQRSIRPRLAEARDRLSSGQPAEAIRFLTEAIAIDPESAVAYYLRARCHMTLVDPDRACTDIDRAVSLAAAEDSDGRDIAPRIAELQAEIEELRHLVETFGGVTAFRMRQQAITEFRKGRFENAASVLRRALDVAEPAGREALHGELRMCLEAQAQVEFAGAHSEVERGDLERARATCDRALAIDPDYFPARHLRAQYHIGRDDVAAATADLDAAAGSARRAGREQNVAAVDQLRATLVERVRGFGGAAASEKRQAAAALRDRDTARAAALLREALAVAEGSAPLLKQELCVCLNDLAVEQIGSGNGRALDSAEALLAEAVGLNPDNTRARENLAAVRQRRAQAGRV